jgi:hypothetical protein
VHHQHGIAGTGAMDTTQVQAFVARHLDMQITLLNFHGNPEMASIVV